VDEIPGTPRPLFLLIFHSPSLRLVRQSYYIIHRSHSHPGVPAIDRAPWLFPSSGFTPRFTPHSLPSSLLVCFQGELPPPDARLYSEARVAFNDILPILCYSAYGCHVLDFVRDAGDLHHWSLVGTTSRHLLVIHLFRSLMVKGLGRDSPGYCYNPITYGHVGRAFFP